MRPETCLAVLALAFLPAAAEARGAAAGLKADDIPVAHTPPGQGGYGRTFPPPVLAKCTEPLVTGAPDLRGIWRLVDHNGKTPQRGEHLHNYAERIEQCGNRIVDMGGGTIADARADGTEANAVHDVSVRDFRTPIVAIATYEAGAFILRPKGMPGIEVRRWLEPDGRMGWTRPDLGRMRLERIGGPNDPYTREE